MRTIIRRVRINDRIPYMMHNDINIRHAYRNEITIVDDYDVVDPTIKPFAEQYFTIESLEDGNTITFNKGSGAPNITFYYSTDNGSNWSSFSSTTSISLNTNEKIMLKATSNGTCSAFNDNNAWRIYSSDHYVVYGNIMSLLYGDNFIGETSLGSHNNYTFFCLFNYSIETNLNIIDVSNLVMPATILKQGCYAYMFYGCGITKSPILPAKSLQSECYRGMFERSKVIQVTCLAENTSSNYVSFWLDGVPSNGTFYKSPNASWPSGSRGIPSSWTIVDYAS